MTTNPLPPPAPEPASEPPREPISEPPREAVPEPSPEAVSESPREAAPQPSPEAAPAFPRMTALLVDDEGAIRKLGMAILGLRGFVTITAEDGVQALEIAGQRTEPIALLLTDLSMPKMGGRELIRQLQLLHPETKVIAISGYEDGLLPGEDPLDPSVTFLPKPFGLRELDVKLREVFSDWEWSPIPLQSDNGPELFPGSEPAPTTSESDNAPETFPGWEGSPTTFGWDHGPDE